MAVHNGSIEIVKSLQGKVFLVTGATGFLAKVLVEKILRSVPDNVKIYLILRASDKEAALERLKKEIIDAELFKCLEHKYGESYPNFMLSKLVPVAGNLCEPNLGLEAHTSDMIATDVDVIVNSAASTAWDERYDASINTNTRGPSRLMEFAKMCKKLKLFLHVSTAYANGQRKGKILEKPFRMGDSIASEEFKLGNLSTSTPISALDVGSEIRLALNPGDDFNNHPSPDRYMRKLGTERAKKYGWHDTYSFTKAMGEMVIDSMRGEIPVVIIRPSVIEGTYKEPFPGWIQGNRMLDPLIKYHGKGHLTCLLADPDCIVDIVPADMVANAILAATAMHCIAPHKADISIYHIGSSILNPLTLQEMATIIFEHFKSNPVEDSHGRPVTIHAPMKFCKSMDEFTAHISRHLAQPRELMARGSSSKPNLAELVEKKLTHMATLYEPYCFYKGRYKYKAIDFFRISHSIIHRINNRQKLMESMSQDEKLKFGFDVSSIVWKDYIANVHIPGLRKHVMKENRPFLFPAKI